MLSLARLVSPLSLVLTESLTMLKLFCKESVAKLLVVVTSSFLPLVSAEKIETWFPPVSLFVLLIVFPCLMFFMVGLAADNLFLLTAASATGFLGTRSLGSSSRI